MTDRKSGTEEEGVKPAISKESEKQLKKDKGKESPDTIKKDERAYSMRPTFGEGEMFPLPTIKTIMNTIMSQKLKDKTYDKVLATTWTREIADEVNQQIASNPKVKRYKHVVQVMLGQELGAGATYNSRCCWDCDCDTSVSEVFSNTSLFCVCTVFGTYQY